MDDGARRRLIDRGRALVNMHESEPPPTLVLKPPDDEEFHSSAVRLIEGGFVEPADLQARLRARWPQALVRPRELAGEHARVWYVYRDGHWVPARR